MGKKVKILILMGMTISLLSCSIIEENSKKNIDIATNVEEMEVVESEEVIQEDIEEIKREIKAIDLTPNININYNYEVIGDKNICSDILFTDKYTDMEGITTFRGNNFRNSASYGISKISKKELSVKWKTTTSFSSWGGGAGWTGQPAIIKWNEDIKSSMNIYDEFKNQENFTEVIYASLDGKIYFLDLQTGNLSRNTINVGNPIKGSLSIDSREIPMLYG